MTDSAPAAQAEPAPNTITLRNSQREVMRIQADGSIIWMNQKLDTPVEVGRGLAAFVAQHMPQPWTTMDGYQKEAMTYAVQADQTATLLYGACGLAGEAGEVCDKIKKVVRDGNGTPTPEQVQAIGLELSDVLWYTARLATLLGLSLSDVATANLNKLHDRRERGVLGGAGDAR